MCERKIGPVTTSLSMKSLKPFFACSKVIVGGIAIPAGHEPSTQGRDHRV